MLKLTRKFAAVAAGGVLALAAAAPAAHAMPEPCGGEFLISDAAGDQAYKQQGQTVFATPSNTDVRGLFFRVDDGKVTANVVMEDLTALTPPDDFEVIRVRVYVTVDGTVRYLQALINEEGATFTYGQEFEAVYTEDGETTGAIFQGKPGIVQIVLPADAGGTPGTELKATSASIGGLTVSSAPPESQLPPIYFGFDTAPDGAADGPDTTPVSCAATPPAGEEPPTGGETPGGGPSQPPSSGNPPPGGQPNQGGQTEVKMTLARAALSAKKVNKKRKGSLVLRTSEALTDVVAALKKGSKTVGRVKLAKLDRRATLKFKFKRKLRKGAHKLVVTAKRADGSAVSQTLAVKVGR